MIKLAVVVDDVGAADQEIETIANVLRDLCRLPIEMVASGHDVGAVARRRDDIDLLVIDYGGMGLSSSTAWDQARAAQRWAREHPGKLLIVWTLMTRWLYEDTLDAEFGHLDNVAYRCGDNSWNFDQELDALAQKLHAWYGTMPKEEE